MRALISIALSVVLLSCAGSQDIPESSETDPTSDFEIPPPEVDTGWPEVGDTYQMMRVRSPDTGWRIKVVDPTRGEVKDTRVE